MTSPHIAIAKDGPFWRVIVEPETALPAGWSRPSTFSSQPLAAMSAKLLADASGLPIVDMAKAGS